MKGSTEQQYSNLLRAAFEVIDKSIIGKFVARKRELIAQTDPSRIYVENIRSFFGISNGAAKLICASAVKAGVFSHHVGILCPRHRQIIAAFEYGEDAPRVAHCNICELTGESSGDYSAEGAEIIDYYSLTGGRDD